MVEELAADDLKLVQNPILSDDLNLLDEIRLHYQDMPDGTLRFMNIMKDWRSQALPTATVIARILDLFHPQPI